MTTLKKIGLLFFMLMLTSEFYACKNDSLELKETELLKKEYTYNKSELEKVKYELYNTKAEILVRKIKEDALDERIDDHNFWTSIVLTIIFALIGLAGYLNVLIGRGAARKVAKEELMDIQNVKISAEGELEKSKKLNSEIEEIISSVAPQLKELKDELEKSNELVKTLQKENKELKNKG